MDKLTKNDWVIRPLFLLSALALIFAVTGNNKAQSQTQNKPVAPTVVEQPVVDSLVIQEKKEIPVIKGWSLNIESININIPLGQTTLGKNRELLVPADANKAAWYVQGPKPGNTGTALITGHYDANGGRPGVFYNLRNVKVNDEIRVGRDDGTVAVFKVDKLEVYKQDSSFPWKEVYRTIGDPGLRIITCHGTYNPKTGRYSHNLVVYASLIEISS